MNGKTQGDHNRSSASLRIAQRRAAWGVFLRRPAGWAILICLLPVTLMTISLLMDSGGRRSDSRSNAPSYRPLGKTLRLREDIAACFRSGQVDDNIRSVDFSRCVSHNPREGSAYLMLEPLTADQIRSGAAELQPTESVPFEEAGQLLEQFPSLEAIEFRGQQLRKASLDVLNRLQKLQTIELNTPAVHLRDIEQLSQITNLQQLKLSAYLCDPDLSPLAQLPKLRSITLASGSATAPDSQKRRLVSPETIHSLASLPHLEELVVSDDSSDLTWLFHAGLDDRTEAEYGAFVDALRSLPNLRRVYIGNLIRDRSCDVYRRLAADLPGVSVRPARYNQALAERLSITLVGFMIAVILATIHLMCCSALPQHALIDGANRGHQRVFMWMVFAGIVLGTAAVTLSTHAALLPILSVHVLLIAICVRLTKSFCYGPDQQSTAGNLLCSFGLAALIWLPQLALFLFGAEVAWFLLGQQPLLAGVMIVAGLWMLASDLRHLLTFWRLWSESGIPLAATLMEFQQAFTAQKQKFAKTGRIHRIGKSWLENLEAIVQRLRNTPESWWLRLQLWSAPLVQLGLRRLFFGVTVLFPLIMVVPSVVTWQLRGSMTTETLETAISQIASFLPVIGMIVGASFYGRFPMFEAELLRPVSRDTWRSTVLLTLLTGISILSLITWLEATCVRIAVTSEWSIAWHAASLFAALVSSLVISGLIAWVVIVRRLWCAILSIVVTCIAYVPAIVLLSGARGPGRRLIEDFPDPQFWVAIVAAELVVGTIIFRTAWQRWMSLEAAGE